MMSEHGVVTRLLGLTGMLLFLTAAANRAQEPAGPNEKPAAAAKKISSPPDAKASDDPKAAAAAFLESAYQEGRAPEAVRMLAAILRGSQMGPNEGWFGPADTRYSWKWLAERCGVDPAKGSISRDGFRGPEAWFARLDRNKDGVITANDLDWSPRSPYMQMLSLSNRLFRKLNAQGNGRLTKEELVQFFDKAALGNDHVTAESFRDALLEGMSAGFQPGDAPSPAQLIRGLFAGEIGSMNEGPNVGQPAPNFTLKTIDGKNAVSLANVLGSKPVVLIFGNFTCGPFRAYYPGVETVYERYKTDAHFLMVYVREAHPTDGWKMDSNSRLGVAVKQPATIEDRVTVASQFCQQVKPVLPVVVDEINDPVGHTYSGMPARLYVIDSQGKVAYKSGRGPFGFLPGEMEQALIMLLLDEGSLGGQQRRP